MFAMLQEAIAPLDHFDDFDMSPELKLEIARIIDWMMLSFVDWCWSDETPLGINLDNDSAADVLAVESEETLATKFKKAADHDSARQRP